jgi:type IV secretory pathway VirB4 component
MTNKTEIKSLKSMLIIDEITPPSHKHELAVKKQIKEAAGTFRKQNAALCIATSNVQDYLKRP